MKMATANTKQISARLEKSVHKNLKKRLAKDKISLQEFIDATVRLYIGDSLKFKKTLEVELNPADVLHLQLVSGEGYQAESVDDLVDQLEGKKKLKPIKL
jgi:hypothetical protein